MMLKNIVEMIDLIPNQDSIVPEQEVVADDFDENADDEYMGDGLLDDYDDYEYDEGDY